MQEDDASDDCDDNSAETASNNAVDDVKTDATDKTAVFAAYYAQQLISDDAAKLFAKRLPIAVRVNQSSPCAAVCAAALRLHPTPVAGCFIVDATSELLVAAQEVGAIVRQELVSCIPPSILAAAPGDIVADLCAAPGMKALQLLDAIGPEGLVVASEVDRKRLAVLVRRARRSTAKGAFLALCADARRFPGMRRRTGWKQKYDKVLCDVPCSGDGTARKKRSVIRTWDVRHALGLHALQLSILCRGIELLNYGGRLVFSTCSLNPLENESVVAAALGSHAGLVTLVEAPTWARDLSAPGLSSWVVPSASYGTTREVFTRFGDVSNPKKARVSATMFPPADPIRAQLSLARRFLPSEACDSGGFFVAIFERSGERRPPEAPRAVVETADVPAGAPAEAIASQADVPLPAPVDTQLPTPADALPAAPPADGTVREGDWLCGCGTNNFGKRARCFSCKRRRLRVITAAPSKRPPSLLARFGSEAAPRSTLDAFCDEWGLCSDEAAADAAGVDRFPAERAFLLKRPRRSLLVIASAALADLAISENWAAAADVGCALCEVLEEGAARWPLFDEGLDVLARCASRRRVTLTPRRLLSLLGGAQLEEFGADGAYVVTTTLSVGAATGRVAVGASVADGVISLSSSARLCDAVRGIVCGVLELC